MTLRSAYGPEKLVLSFELFPPKTSAAEDELFRHLDELMSFEPGYVTCTYGAGGSTRDKTLDIVSRVRSQFRVPVASHLTCVGATIDDLRRYLVEAQRLGIENIVALRGDAPRGEATFKAVDGGFRYACELVSLVRREFSDFGIAVAGYPEVHHEAASPTADLDHLKFKVDCGADVVITQLFYDNDDFFRFEERCRQAGIRVPIVPGVLPITNLAQIRRITGMCGARLPPSLLVALERHEDSLADQFEVGVDHATRQVQGLVDGRVPGIHFYVLNKSPATCRVLRSVVRPA